MYVYMYVCGEQGILKHYDLSKRFAIFLIVERRFTWSSDRLRNSPGRDVCIHAYIVCMYVYVVQTNLFVLNIKFIKKK